MPRQDGAHDLGVGEIQDEHDEALAAKLSQSGEGVFSIDAGMTIREANRKFRLKLPESDNYTTVAGFLISRAGRLLNQGDTVEYGGAKFTVERVSSRRVTRVNMEYLPELSQSGQTSQTDGDAQTVERK